MSKNYYILYLVGILSVLFTSCREDDVLVYSESHKISIPQFTDIDGFYLLNEGNMGSTNPHWIIS